MMLTGKDAERFEKKAREAEANPGTIDLSGRAEMYNKIIENTNWRGRTMKYLTFLPVRGGLKIMFNKTDTLDWIIQEVDGIYHFKPSQGGGIYPDYILREIVQKLEELNK